MRLLAKKRDREMTVMQWLDEFRNDLTFAVRQLRHSPAFTLVAHADPGARDRRQ